MKNPDKLSMVVILAILSTFTVSFTGPFSVLAMWPARVNLWAAGNFAILSKAAITNIPSSIITGDIGASPISGSAIGVTCAQVTGTIYAVDATGPLPCSVTNGTLLTAAVSDMETAYTDAAGRAPDATELGAGNIWGLTLVAGVYKWGTNVTIPSDITLSGSSNDVWIFEIAGDLNLAAAKQIILAGWARAANIFWQVGGPTGATLETTSLFNGNILSAKQIILRTGAVLNGNALAQTQVVLDQNTVTAPTAPIRILTSVHIVSDNASGSLAEFGDIVTVSFTGSRALTGVTSTIGGQVASITGAINSWQASRTMTGSDSNGNVAFTVNYTDLNGNTGSTVIGTTDSSKVTFQKSIPWITLTYSPATLTGWSVIATVTGTWMRPAVTFSWSNSFTFTNNGSHTFTYFDSVWNEGSTGATVAWIDKTAPVVSGTTVKNITGTGVRVTFNFAETNFSSGTYSIIAYTGGNISNIAETGALSISSSPWSGSGIFSNLTPSIHYGYLINLTDDVGNTSSSTGRFTTASLPIALTGWLVATTGATTVTGATIPAWSILSLNDTSIIMVSDSFDSSSITWSLSISNTDISITGSTAWNGIIIPPTLVNNTTQEAALWSEIGSGITVTETVKVWSDWALLVPSTATGYFNVAFAVPWYASGTVLDLYKSKDGANWTKVSPDGTCTLDTNSMCSFRTNELSLFAPVLDGTPDVFTFTPLSGAELNTTYISSTTLTGMNTNSPISIIHGQYQIGTGSYTASTGTVNNGDTLTVKVTSASSYLTPASATVTIAWLSTAFTVTTKAAPVVNWGGGGGWVIADFCPRGDTSPSYYDGICGTGNIGTGSISQSGTVTTTSVTTSIFTGSTFHVPEIIITRLADIHFTDITDNWAKLYILRLAVRGIIDNASFYRPNDSLTRAEFLKIVINTAGWNPPTTNIHIPFNDVSSNIWYARYVSFALSKGMITGANTDFRPNDKITRAEATKILMTAPGIKINEPSVITFVDLDSKSDLTKYIEAAKSMGILSGEMRISGQWIFRPNDSITRSEIAKVVANAFHL